MLKFVKYFEKVFHNTYVQIIYNVVYKINISKVNFKKLYVWHDTRKFIGN